MPPLDNPRWERFAQSLAEGYCACEAYTRAGYKFNSGNCIRLKGNERVRARLAELQLVTQRNSEITTESVLAELETARVKAMETSQMSAAVRASEARAKIAGLVTERHEITIEEQYQDIR